LLLTAPRPLLLGRYDQAGRLQYVGRRKTALNAFDITFDGRLSAAPQ
jgi:hypothetical protein